MRTPKKEAIKDGIVKTIESKGKNYFKFYIQTGLKEKFIPWYLSIPFRILNTGIISKNNRKLVVKDLRESFGIDLTKDVEIKKSDVEDREKNLINQIELSKEGLYDADTKLSKEMHSIILKRNKIKLAKLKNRNLTYNKFELRNSNYDNKNLERILAAFLILTRQVTFKNGKYIHLFDEGTFVKVSDVKSFDVKSKNFYQRIFPKVLNFKAKDFKYIKENSFQELIRRRKIPPIRIKFNNMYYKVMYKRILKLSTYISLQDACAILKSLYKYKEETKNVCSERDRKVINKRLNYLEESFIKYKEGNVKEAKKLFSKACNQKDKVFKKNAEAVLFGMTCCFMSVAYLKENYYNKEEVNKRFISREEVYEKFISKEEVEKNYTRKM